MKITSSLDRSYSKVYPAAEAMSGQIAVSLSSDGLKICAEGEIPLGILTDDEPIMEGESVDVQTRGGADWLAGEEIAAGDMLAVGEGGLAVKATSGKFIFAQALEDAGIGATLEVLITRAGIQSGG